MSTGTILAIAIPLLVLLALVLVFASARRRDASAATGVLSSETKSRDRGPMGADDAGLPGAPPSGREIERSAALEWRGGAVDTKPPEAPVAWVPPDEETLGVSRRQFFNRGAVTLMTIGTAGFGAASLGFLWPGSAGGFGSEIGVGPIGDILSRIDEGDGFAYYPEGRMWITRYPAGALEKARAVYTAPELSGMEAGVVALYQKCPHLGCRVPECATSQWFECPCHGSQYNQVGEKKGGPAPRGMDRFAMSVSGGQLSVDTGTIIDGPPIGTNTTGQEAEGPHCIGGATH